MYAHSINYYCMTGRSIWGNIQFEGGSIGPTVRRDNTEDTEQYIRDGFEYLSD